MSGFIYYMHDGPRTFRFELAGNLAGADAQKLDQAWRTASSTLDGKTVAVDVTFLTGIDEKARLLLERWWRAGAHFVANSAPSRILVESITGQPYAPAGNAVGPTFEPLFTAASFRAALAALVVAVTLLFPAKASGAADLKQETLDAWDQYLHQQDARMLDRTKGTFLWAEESPDRLRRLRAGEVLVAPVIHAPEAVASGLIHHWIGAAFIPGARIDDVIAVVRDYDRYSEFYKPSVIEGKTLSRRAGEDRFSVVVVDKAMFMKRSLHSEYDSRYAEVDRDKWFSVARTSRVQELSRLGLPVPDGEASGYIWRLSTVSRYEERDGGVYLETEALALSRTIPATLHWLVDPIVRRVARSSLTMTLEQTRDATGSAVKSASALAASRSRIKSE
ncbi:MAG: hypothetical protein ABSF12_08555 [Bryobacteraceae bacterium]